MTDQTLIESRQCPSCAEKAKEIAALKAVNESLRMQLNGANISATNANSEVTRLKALINNCFDVCKAMIERHQ